MLRARRDVVGAEKIFARCVAAHPDGALLETALVGRADALEALGRGAEARRVWAELLRRFPDSLHAERARR
jgi:TolA-binding protein